MGIGRDPLVSALTPFAPSIWLIGGSTLFTAGFGYPTRATVIQLSNGDLVIISPVALSPALPKALDALGPVRHLIAPNHLHHTYLQDWISAYPDATVYGAPKLAQKRSDLHFDHILGDTAPPAWANEISQVVFQGNRITTEVIFFHHATGTMVFTDLLQQFDRGYHRGWRAVIARLDLMVSPRPTVPRKFRLATTDRKAARHALQHILTWPVQAIIVAHGKPVTKNAAHCLRAAFKWLKTPE